jgi:hypothetical protein
VTPHPALTGSVSLSHRQAQVPIGESDAEHVIARGVRMHESMHVRFSPAQGPVEWAAKLGLPESILYYAEEARMDLLAARVAPDLMLSLLHYSVPRCNATLPLHDQIAAAVITAAINRRARRPRGLHPAALAGWDWVRRQQRRPLLDPRDPRWAERLAQHIVRHLPPPPRGPVPDTMPPGTEYDEAEDAAPPRLHDEGDPDWSRPDILRAPLTERTTQTDGSRTVAAYYGRLRKPLRLDRGGRAFVRRRRQPKASPIGSVLIDTSGSMGWAPDHLVYLIHRIPAATVATYSSDSRGSDGSTVRVYARGGRCASLRAIEAMELRSGGGNTCDGPALEWLARQPGPRVWVSDGGVTERGDTYTRRAREYCAAVCERAGIVRVPDQTTLRSMLERRRC